MFASDSSSDSRALPDRPHVRPPRRLYPRLSRRQLFLALILSLFLLSDMLGGWIFLIPQAYAAKRPSDPPAKTTFHTFLKDHNPTHAYRGPLVFPSKAPAVPKGPHAHAVNMTTLLPSAEPPTMQPINQALSTSSLLGSPTSGAPLDLKSSDGRFEVQLAPGSVDLSQATVAPGLAPSGTLTLQISQVAGHFAEQMNLLGTYQLQVSDASNRPISGIRLQTPLTLIYHYQRWEIDALDLDPDSLYLSWPGLLAAARAAKASSSGLVIPLTNDPVAQTLTGQSSVLGPGPLTVGGDAQNQSPPPALLGGVQGNSGQFGLSYPLSLPPNARGFVPHLLLSYSSGGPNQRNSAVSPAGDVGDGWSLTMGSITAQNYPNGSASAQTWYFLSGVDNISDRLAPASQSGFYQTFHISHLRIHQVTSSDTGQPCFNVYDTSGTFYEFGCDSDALQFWTETNGTQHNYRWDLDKIISPNEGPSAMREYITVSYIQDCKPCTTNKTWRDSAITQILYGQRLSDKSQDTVAGTIDFFYRAPFTHSPWTQSYGTNYNCTGSPPVSTDLRCDDPQDDGTVKKPLVMSTFSLQSLTAYVGDDSTSLHKAFSYSFAYQDRAFPVCYDPYMLVQEYCAGEHLLTSITPSVYQNGTQHQLRPVTLSYTEGDNFYIDSSQKTHDNSQQYGGQTFWRYLTDYQDTNTGVGEHITYTQAHANTDGTPYITDGGGNIIDDRHDPLYCTLHDTDPNQNNRCHDNYNRPDDRAWSVQVVTQLTSWGKDSSALAPSTTTYNYRLEADGTYSGSGRYCYPAGSSPYLPGQTDCTFDTWIPGQSSSNFDGDWRDYYHGEFRGFQVVYTTSPAGDLTADNYYSTEGWGSPQSNSGNYNSGSLFEEDVYSGNSSSGPLLRKTFNQYTGNNGNPNSCDGSQNGIYPVCLVMVIYSLTTFLEGTGSSNAPTLEIDNTYDDYTSLGLHSGYHNLIDQTMIASNAPRVTKQWNYTPDDQTVSGTVYYTVNKVTHSEIDDSGGHVWACQDTTYDEGVASGVPTPDAGWPTTVKAYSTCGNSSTAITTYSGYDAYGNPVESVDGVGTANSSLYTSAGCTLSTAPVYKSSGWIKTRYTGCSVYDSYHAQPSSLTNALSQTGSLVYDYTQGSLPTSATDPNSQVTTTSYSYDGSGNRTVSLKAPLESGSYTGQSSTLSTCSSSTLPCFEVDSKAILYPNAITRTFYDSLGRPVEKRSTGPDAGHDTVVFVAYNDAQHRTGRRA